MVAKVKFEDFHAVVMSHADALADRGYVHNDSEFVHDVEFTKAIEPGIDCTVMFQWMDRGGFAPANEFNVVFRRLRSLDAKGDVAAYINVQMGLRNLLRGVYGQDPLPKDHFAYWTFQTEAELRKRLEEVEPLIMEYGIPWLEDPNSNLDWTLK